jgi:alanyl-tRNA synthetase
MQITTNQIREKYLKHFEKERHVVIPSSRLVPENDPTTLFTGSGMQPMLPYLLGQKHPLGTRIADSQKCFRSQDVEEVGDNRHTTFFEMLGNWSLGDYFKEEQIAWMWKFLTEELKLDPKKLYFTCFKGAPEIGIPKDTESSQWWQKHLKSVGIDALIGENPESDGMGEGEKIFYYGAKKNWWSRVGVPQNMPVGEPGGPDTEMFFDFEADTEKVMHAKSQFKNDPCHPNCDCGRFMEIGNNVFMEYIRTENGYEKLAQLNVDFGAGLERMAAAVNNDSDMFRIDVFAKVIETIEKLSGKKYNPIPDDKEFLGVDKLTQSFRVILDHLRAATFLIGDDVLPGNKDQNYFVRRLLRRAIRYGRNLGIEKNFCWQVAFTYIEIYKEHYVNLWEGREKIKQAIEDEENQFRKTLANGEKEFERMTERKFFDKIDPITNQVTKGEKINVLSGEDAFNLYQSYGFPIELTIEMAKDKGVIVDDIDFENFKKEFEASRTKHSEDSRAGSEQKFKGGLADNSEIVVRYHTATHLLHEALKQVLGPETNQKGSNITAERLRFDFTHGSKMTPEEITAVQSLVNKWIDEKIPVNREEVDKDEAIARGAVHLFGEKYGDKVSVYTIGNVKEGESKKKSENKNIISMEFCGGPHVENTGTIGHFKITKEEAVSAGVRRIKAVID